MAGFSLVELLLSLSLGLALSGVMLQGLMAEGQSSGRFTSLLREKAWQRRTFALIGADLEQSTSLAVLPDQLEAACNLSGRRVLLQLEGPAGSITYSVGAPPSAIWRGHVLMRCGPAYSLDGLLTRSAASQNRVVLDGLPPQVMAADSCGAVHEQQIPVGLCLEPESSVLTVRLAQQLSGQGSLTVRSEKAFAVPTPVDQALARSEPLAYSSAVDG